jgi:hypothetical protein
MLCPSLFAQKNRIEINMGGYKMYNVFGEAHSIDNTLGLNLSRKINEKMTLEMGYRLHGAWVLYRDRDLIPVRQLSIEEKVDGYDDTGKLIERQNYHYFDAGVRYEVFSAKNQALSFRQDLSVAYGTNVYLKDLSALWISPDEPFHIIVAELEGKKEAQIGGVTGIAYDYHLWENRINIGLDVATRYYTGGLPFQINYGIHLGYNF